MTRPQELDYHLSRLLVLLRHVAAPQRTPLAGLTKLAKLDFLLRYPSFLDRVLRGRDIDWPEDAAVTADERAAVESRMTRYKFGPWDDRYYPLVGALVGMGLAELVNPGGTIQLRLSEDGKRVADELASTSEWRQTDGRAALIAQHFNWSGNRLRNLIYDELPDVVDRPHRTVI